MIANILAIGTELTTGQITNRNSAWISAQLLKFGVETRHHLTVPDDRNLNLQSLQWLSEDSELVFITGGLGPTSDDFTREVVAEWAKEQLQFDAASWKHIEDRLLPRGIEVKEIQRQQCFFPTSAEILINSEGTANGFYIQKSITKNALAQTSRHICHVFVLPGPPREIEAIWKSGVAPRLQKLCSNLDPKITRSWDLLGLPESQVAERVEEVYAKPEFSTIKNSLHTEIEFGYRVHLPYVEFKLSFRKSLEEKISAFVDAISAEFKTEAVLRDGEDLIQKFEQTLAAFPAWEIQDEVSGSYLLSRLEPALRKRLSESSQSNSSASAAMVLRNSAEAYIDSNPKLLEFKIKSQLASDKQKILLLILKKVDDFSAEALALIIDADGTELVLGRKNIPAHNRSSAMEERRKQYFAECALLYWQATVNPQFGQR